MKKIAIFTYNQAALFELGCASELFALPRPEINAWYHADIIALDDGPHTTTGGLSLNPKKVASLNAYDMLVVPSWPSNITQVKGVIADQLRQFHADGKRIISFCSGAFLLACLGLLDHRQATTHWRYAQKFKQRYPRVQYVDNVLYVYDGQIGCSAGSAAALDLGLEVIRQDYGQAIANQVAKRLVIPAHRKGGQSQYVASPIVKTPNQFANAIEWAVTHLSEPFNIELLATKATMSRRSFDRKFNQAYNQTPKNWLTHKRLDLAKELLEKRSGSIDQIAQASGFDNATTLRHHFRKQLGLSPRQYRDQFST